MKPDPDIGRRLVAAMADRHGITVEQLCRRQNPRQRGSLKIARWETMDLLERQGFSLLIIGKLLGGLNHTTVLHGLKRWREMQQARSMEEAGL